MTFQFGPPAAKTTTPVAPAGLPAGFGAPAAAPPPMDPTAAAMYALQGLNEATPEDRRPFLPPNLQYDLKIDAVRIGGMAAESKVGFCFYIDVTVNNSSNPAIAAPGAEFSHRISGFTSVTGGKKFALQELKQFMAIALASRGLTLEWNGDWVQAAIQMAQQDLAVGVRVFAQTSEVAGKTGNKKIKAAFHPAQ